MEPEDFSADMEPALNALRSGQTLLYPTDTIWGLGCDATNEEAVHAIFQLKQRPPDKSCIVLLAEEKDLLQFVANLDLEVFDFLEQTTRPTTIIYENAIGIADPLIAADGTAAFRIAKEPFCKALIKRLRKPLVSTSANISGETTPHFFPDIDARIITGAGYVVKYRQDDATPALPSTIIRWKSNGRHEVLRP